MANKEKQEKENSSKRSRVKENQKTMKPETRAEESMSNLGHAKEKTARAVCKDRDCPVHGMLKVRGRTFQGRVIRKLPRRLTIEFERMVPIRKYERYKKSRTKIHARLPDCLADSIKVGDIVKVQECRPLSKIIHFVVVKKIKPGEQMQERN